MSKRRRGPHKLGFQLRSIDTSFWVGERSSDAKDPDATGEGADSETKAE